MASGFKFTETQLVAIYKLEFYKNKKNWKLYEDVKKEPTRPLSPKTTNNLNKTYSVTEGFPEPECDVEQVSAHNKAFLHEEPDDAPDPPPPDDVPPSPPTPPQSMSWPQSSHDHIWSGDKTGTWVDPQQEWGGAEAASMRDEHTNDQLDGAGRQHNPWQPASHVELAPAEDPLDQLCQLSAAQAAQTAEDWLSTQAHPGLGDDYVDTYDEHDADDSAEFVRGAHYAPHSSEIDLSIAPECSSTFSKSLCVLNVRQLSRAIQRHHSALVLLLREQALRERLTSRSLLFPPMPFEECPTRDTDPLRPPDSVLSGSHALLHGADTGRGRGRLQQHRVIGIGMGRPYRL